MGYTFIGRSWKQFHKAVENVLAAKPPRKHAGGAGWRVGTTDHEGRASAGVPSDTLAVPSL